VVIVKAPYATGPVTVTATSSSPTELFAVTGSGASTSKSGTIPVGGKLQFYVYSAKQNSAGITYEVLFSSSCGNVKLTVKVTT
jgi:hypothetical protein